MKYLLEIGTEIFQKLQPQKREKIIDSAISEFAENGYRKASVNKIVKIAGISKGSLFQYFASKPLLFTATVSASSLLVKDYLKNVRDETDGESFFDRLETLIRSGFLFIDKHPQMAKIYFHLLQSGEAPSGTEQVLELRESAERFLGELLSEAQEKGELRSDIHLEKLSFIMNSLLETLMRAYYSDFIGRSSGLYKADAARRDLWISTVVDFVKNGVSNQDHAKE